jgi:hypothetical protein
VFTSGHVSDLSSKSPSSACFRGSSPPPQLLLHSSLWFSKDTQDFNAPSTQLLKTTMGAHSESDIEDEVKCGSLNLPARLVYVPLPSFAAAVLSSICSVRS